VPDMDQRYSRCEACLGSSSPIVSGKGRADGKSKISRVRPIEIVAKLARFTCGRAIKPLRLARGTSELFNDNSFDQVTCDGPDSPVANGPGGRAGEMPHGRVHHHTASGSGAMPQNQNRTGA
jgi:hypothetical protein